jgi:SRSO17 transposase
MAKSGCCWRTRVGTARPCVIAPSLCRKSGPTTGRVAHTLGDQPSSCWPRTQLARPMLQRAFAAGVPAAWVTGESVYGEERRRRGWWAEQDHAYGLAVSGQEDGGRAGQQQQVQTMLATLRPAGWSRLRAGAGAQGPRWDDWTWLPRVAPLQPAWRRGLLVCRRVSDPTALPAYIVFAPQERTLATVVPVAGRRWTVAQGCAEAKGAGGLEHDEVRSWTGGLGISRGPWGRMRS